jgi:hypothetical protein
MVLKMMSLKLQERAKNLIAKVITFTEELQDSPLSLQDHLNDGLPEMKSFLGDCAVESIKNKERINNYNVIHCPSLTKEKAIEEACSIVSLAYHSIGDYSYPSDGFCNKCSKYSSPENYQNAGQALNYVRLAVLNQLKNDGYEISSFFDPMTGKEMVK